MSPDLHYWNSVFEQVRRQQHAYAPETHWLKPYIPMMRGQQVKRVLEVGCGSGVDTRFLVESGFDVTSTDFSANALALVRSYLPEVKLLLHDTRDAFPFPNDSFDMVLASLSLHYFDETTTSRILAEIKRLLRPRGLLLYRVNSTSDQEFMSGQGDLLEPNFFLQNGIRKRYFSIDDCRRAFRGFEEIVLEEKTLEPYGKPKTLVEGLLRKINE